MENYVPIHCHSTFSQYDGISTPEEMVEQAVKHGHKACAITDHGTMAGTYLFQQAALKAGVKPLLGMEGYVVDRLVDEDERGKRVRMKNNHVVLIAKNADGWKSLMRLNYLSNSDDDHFYYKPRFTFRELFENRKGLIVSSACLASGFANLLRLGREDDAISLFEDFINEFGEDFYAEIQLNELTDQKIYNSWLIGMATRYGVPIVIGGDCHYATPDGVAAQELAFRIRNDDENEVGQVFATRKLYYHGVDDFKQFNKEWGYGYTDAQIESWCANNVALADSVDFVIPERTKMHLPRQAFDEDGEFMRMAKEGLCKFFGVKNYSECPSEYRERLDFELRILVKKGVSRYFLILADILKFCEENNISHGCGRGSAAGSLAAMCVGITSRAIDPLKNGLLFERFVSEQRLIDCYIDYSKSGNCA